MYQRHAFIVPDLSGPLSGGTLYNRELVRALRAERVLVDVLALSSALAHLHEYGAGTFWLDSLYLDAVPQLLAARGREQALGLVLHYLPSLVEHGDEVEPAAISQHERLALTGADWILVPSESMRASACRLGARMRTTFVVEPGRAARAARPTRPEPFVKALLVAALTAGKGILPLLEALAPELVASDRFKLTIAGDEARDPSYASTCRRAVRASAELSNRVLFAGELPHDELLAVMNRSSVLLSASRMESYGMALAEARHLGLPILARAGGNVAAHIAADAGGELVRDERELARAAVALCRDPAEHQRRQSAALAARTPARPWQAAALEFLRFAVHQSEAR